MSDPREDRPYCREVATLITDNWFDRHDAIAAWSDAQKHFFCSKGYRDGEPYNRDTVIQALVDSFRGTGPAKHKIIGSYFVNPKTLLTQSTCLDMDAHRTEDDTDESFRKKFLRMEEETDCIEYYLQKKNTPFDTARSKSGKGYHIRLFFSEPVDCRVARRVGKLLLIEAGISRKRAEEIEVNPKQEVFEQAYGNQVAIPGSRWFFEQKGGSTLVEPRTHKPIPFGEWRDYLKSLGRIPVEKLRERAPELWIPTPKRIVVPQSEIKIEGVPPLRTVEDIVTFIESKGVVAGSPRGCGGRWTDKIILRDCPNAQAHTSNRKFGAAVLFNAETRAIGYKCQHAGCEGFSWRKLLAMWGHKVNTRPKGEWVYDETPTVVRDAVEPPAESGAVEPPTSKKKRRRRGSKQITQEDRKRFAAFGYKNHLNENVKISRIAKRHRRAGLCKNLHQLPRCNTHGPRGVTMHPCDDTIICTSCAQRESDLIEAHIEANWPEKLVLVTGYAPDRPGLWKVREEIYKQARALMAHNKGYLPRYVEGRDRVHFFWPERLLEFCRDGFADLKVIDRSEAAQLASDAWYSVHEHYLENLKDTALIDLRDDPWLASRKHRTGGGDEVCRELTWTNIDRERKKASKKWKEEHPGLERGCCDEVVGEKDGKPVFCGAKMPHDLIFGPTGQFIATKMGAFNETEQLKWLNGTEVELAWSRAGPPAFAAA